MRRLALTLIVAAPLVVAPGADGAVLYSQLDAPHGSSDGSTKSQTRDVQVADDFEVPAGETWHVNRIEARGGGSATSTFNLFFFGSAGALPAATPEYSASGPLADGATVTDVDLLLVPPAVLPAGRHWVSIQGVYGSATGDPLWSWGTRAAQAGFPASLRSCTTGCQPWSARTTPQVGPDQLFRVSGTKTGGSPGGDLPGGGDRPPRFKGRSFADPRTFVVNLGGATEKPVTGSAKRGTTFKYALSEAATVTFTIQRKRRGRRVGGRCRKPTRTNRERKTCIRHRRVGAFRHRAGAGPNRKRFSGKIGKKVLRPGRYRARLVARDAAGNRSAPRNVSFRVVTAAGKRR